MDYWEKKFRASSSSKSSLKYFKPEYMSLKSCHPIWSSCSANSFEVNKAVIQAKLLSGNYRCDWTARHWSVGNKEGFCKLCPGKKTLGTIEHMLVDCTALDDKRRILQTYIDKQTSEDLPLKLLVNSMLNSPTLHLVQFLLDPSAVPEVIIGCQSSLYTMETLFSITRTYCYGLHRRRSQLSGTWKV